MEKKRSKRKVKEGIVLSSKMDKTIVVGIGRLAKHKVYGRVIRRSSKFKVHDEKNQAKAGDKVRIMESRPLSKEKKWRLIEVIK
ncbi:MAG: 30S ribosomal protein S17 [Candidatus Omnitrophica bacterium]|nr:30S ribosomal protein S17 [Candidatus Omnitrophota bacterium]